MYYVYILLSRKDRHFYIGSTKNLQRRMGEHRRGKTKSLKFRLPVDLIYTETLYTKKAALAREKQLKSYKGGNEFKKLVALTLSKLG